MRDYVTRREYDAWIAECAALAIACGYPIQDAMINDSTGLVLGTDQYEAFVNGMWSREPYEVFAIFEAMNEPAVDGLPRDAMAWAEYGGLCDKLMIVHPGKFCSAHFHWRKTEYYEVVLGEMDVFYSAGGHRLPRARGRGRRDHPDQAHAQGRGLAERHRAARGPRGELDAAHLVSTRLRPAIPSS